MVSPIGLDDWPALLQAYVSAHDDLRSLAADVTQADWSAASSLPGWTVADCVAHVVSLEAALAGHDLPKYEPEWSRLPHATEPFAQAVEVGVDYRRGRSRAQLLEEFDLVLADRMPMLEAITDPMQSVDSLMGPMPAARGLRMRTFDTWVHEQDIRAALGRPGGFDSPGAAAAAGQLFDALCVLWGKKAGAQSNEQLILEVSDPGISGSWRVQIGDDGRARLESATDGPTDGSAPRTRLSGTWPALAAAMCGRTWAYAGVPMSLTAAGPRAAALRDVLVVTP